LNQFVLYIQLKVYIITTYCIVGVIMIIVCRYILSCDNRWTFLAQRRDNRCTLFSFNVACSIVHLPDMPCMPCTMAGNSVNDVLKYNDVILSVTLHCSVRTSCVCGVTGKSTIEWNHYPHLSCHLQRFHILQYIQCRLLLKTKKMRENILNNYCVTWPV
jgi:hypothetical protein